MAYYAAGAKTPLPLPLLSFDQSSIGADVNRQLSGGVQHIVQSGGINFGQGNQINIRGDVAGNNIYRGEKSNATKE